jgi:hypothetical protein
MRRQAQPAAPAPAPASATVSSPPKVVSASTAVAHPPSHTPAAHGTHAADSSQHEPAAAAVAASSKKSPAKPKAEGKGAPGGTGVVKERKKREKKGVDGEAAPVKKRGPNKASSAVAAPEGKAPADTGPNKMEFDLDPVTVDEYQTAGHRSAGGAEKKHRADGTSTASSLLEPVLPSDLAAAEEKRARSERREVVGGAHSGGPSMLGGGLYSSQQRHGHSGSAWDHDAVMTRSKILEMCDPIGVGVGSDKSMGIDDNAVKYLAFAAQDMLKEIVEASITSSRRRRNQTAVQQFDKIQHLLQLSGREKGVAIPEHAHNLGMGWSTDIENKTLVDGLEFVQNYDKTLSDLKLQVKKDLMKYDDERRMSGKKRQLSSGQGASAAEADEPWWIQDVSFLIVFLFF